MARVNGAQGIPMLNYVTGSLFDSPAQTLVNTVNTVGIMGKGIAKEFKSRFPEMYPRYRKYCDRKQLVVGKLFLYRTPNKWVLNFPTKKHWRHPSKMEWIESGLEKFVDTYTDQGVTSVSFPQLGCGNGGLNWNDVRPVMEAHLSKLPIPTFVHIAPRSAGFVPEHEEANALLTPREGVEFVRFVRDLIELPTVEAAGEFVIAEEPDEFQAPMRLRLDDQCVLLHFHELESLWHSLTLRGALSVDEFPMGLRDSSREVVEMLTQLEYVRSISFDAGGGKQARSDASKPGIRFAAPAANGSFPEKITTTKP